jgi:hypothetical protein
MKKKMLLYTLIVSLTLTLSGFSGCQISETVTLESSQDGRVASVTPDHAADYATFFASQAWTWSGKPGIVRSLIQFNLDSIPADAIITDAYLYLYHNPDTKHSKLSNSNASFIERVMSGWDASTACWNNQPVTTSINRVYLEESSSDTQDYIVNVLALVKDMKAQGNFGMMLKLASEKHYASLFFASSNHPNSAYHPKLVVTYSHFPF